MVRRPWELAKGVVLTLAGLILLTKDATTIYLHHDPWTLIQILVHVYVITIGVRVLWTKGWA